MGQEILDNLDLEKKIESWSPAEQFIARELVKQNKRCRTCLATVDRHETVLRGMLGGIAILAILFVATVAAALRKIF